jgi:hypothetical protein
MDLETIVHIAVCLKCAQAEVCGKKGPFGIKCEDVKPKVVVITLKEEVETVEAADAFIGEILSEYAAPVIVIATPSSVKFPYFDGLIYYKDSVKVQKLAWQSKVNLYPSGDDFPGCIERAFLVKGNPAPKDYYPNGKWSYLSFEGVFELLGVSLSTLLPYAWK